MSRPVGGDAHDTVAESVSAVLRDKVEGIGGIAEGLGHFAAFEVADDAGEVDILEGDGGLDFLFGKRGEVSVITAIVELEAGHDHAGDPEEDDVWW